MANLHLMLKISTRALSAGNQRRNEKTPHTAIGRERKGRNSNGGCLTLLLRDHAGVLIVTW
jgi:hypothetical protein